MRILLGVCVLALILAACANAYDTGKNLPPGDAARGQELFTQSIGGAPSCSSCHSLDGSTLVGPSLKGYAAVAGTRVSNRSATEYTYESIVRPTAFLVSGYSNLMYNQYAQRLNNQQLADLIAYLLTL